MILEGGPKNWSPSKSTSRSVAFFSNPGQSHQSRSTTERSKCGSFEAPTRKRCSKTIEQGRITSCRDFELKPWKSSSSERFITSKRKRLMRRKHSASQGKTPTRKVRSKKAARNGSKRFPLSHATSSHGAARMSPTKRSCLRRTEERICIRGKRNQMANRRVTIGGCHVDLGH